MTLLRGVLVSMLQLARTNAAMPLASDKAATSPMYVDRATRVNRLKPLLCERNRKSQCLFHAVLTLYAHTLTMHGLWSGCYSNNSSPANPPSGTELLSDDVCKQYTCKL